MLNDIESSSEKMLNDIESSSEKMYDIKRIIEKSECFEMGC